MNETRTEEGARAVIEEALRALQSGEEFGAVAERFSDCKGAGGDLGWFQAGEMVEEFERELCRLEPGERTGVFSTPFGFHVAELRGSQRGVLLGFKEVRADIEKAIKAMSAHTLFLEKVEALVKGAAIQRISRIEAESRSRTPRRSAVSA